MTRANPPVLSREAAGPGDGYLPLQDPPALHPPATLSPRPWGHRGHQLPLAGGQQTCGQHLLPCQTFTNPEGP